MGARLWSIRHNFVELCHLVVYFEHSFVVLLGKSSLHIIIAKVIVVWERFNRFQHQLLGIQPAAVDSKW